VTKRGRTVFVGGFAIDQHDSSAEVAPEPTADGFPSQWHRDRYVHDLRRNITDAQTRLTNDEPSDERTADFEAEITSSVSELERLGEWQTSVRA
jgi:hypothetical protein